MNELTVEEIGSEAGWRAIYPEWQVLSNRCTSNSLFSTHEWLSAWWEHLRPQDARFFVLLVLDVQGRTVAAWPLVLEAEKLVGIEIKVLRFLGHGPSDYSDLLIADVTEPILIALVDYLAGQRHRWQLVELDEWRADSKCRAHLLRLLASRGWITQQKEASRCSGIEVTGGWEDFFHQRFTGPRRRQWRKEWRVLEKALAPLEVMLIRDVGQTDRLCSELAELEAKHPSAAGQRPGILNAPRYGDFVRQMIGVSAPKGWLRISLLKSKGLAIAYFLWFCFSGRLYGYATAYDAAYTKYSPGKLLMLWQLETLWGEANVIDLLRGGEAYKERWCTYERTNVRVRVIRNDCVSRMSRILLWKWHDSLDRNWPRIANAIRLLSNDGLSGLWGRLKPGSRSDGGNL